MLIQNTCQSCGGAIEFEAEQIGQSRSCPHCKQMTVLHSPGRAAPIRKTKPPIEETLEGVAQFFFIAGFVGAALCCLAMFMTISENKGELGSAAMAGFFVAGLVALGGWIMQSAFRALAEIIRLLRILANQK